MTGPLIGKCPISIGKNGTLVALFNKSPVSLEVEKIFCPLGVALLEGRILIGGISITSSTAQTMG